jgi:hypothetical protein
MSSCCCLILVLALVFLTFILHIAFPVILIEDIPLRFNSKNKTKSLFCQTQQYYIIIGILLWQHISIFL